MVWRYIDIREGGGACWKWKKVNFILYQDQPVIGWGQNNHQIHILLQQINKQKRQMSSRLNWSQEEENMIKVLRQVDQISSWKKIAQSLNQKFTDTIRTGKQCRDRYINYVRFTSDNPKLVGWTIQDDKLLFKKFQEHGTKWVLISSEMFGRSENNLKNRFYGAMRKIMRKIAKVQKEMKPKPKKTIKEKQLIKIFEEARKPCDSSSMTDSNAQVYKKLLDLAISQEDMISNEDVKDVISLVNSYNSSSTLRVPEFGKKKSITTDDVSQYSFLEQIESKTETKEQTKEELYDFKEMRIEDIGMDNSINLNPKRSHSLLRDSLKLDFANFKTFENDFDFESLQGTDDPFLFNVGSYLF